MESIQSLPTPEVAQPGPDLPEEKLEADAFAVGTPVWRRKVLLPKTPGDFDYIWPKQHHAPASEEHNRTIEEFLSTGTVSPKREADFAHMGEVAAGAYAGHMKALNQIQGLLWQEEDARKDLAEDIARLQREREAAAAQAPIAEPIKVRGQGLAALTPACRYGSKSLARLDISRESAEDDDPTGEGMENVDRKTRALLNDLLGECHFLMKEVAFRSICQSGDVETRMDFLNAAMRLAETGAKVGDSAGRLRNGPVVSQTAHRMTVEKIVTNLGGRGEGVPAP